MKTLAEMKQIMMDFTNSEYKAIKDYIIWSDFQILLNDKLISLVKGYFKDGFIDQEMMNKLVSEINLRNRALIALESAKSLRKYSLELQQADTSNDTMATRLLPKESDKYNQEPRGIMSMISNIIKCFRRS